MKQALNHGFVFKKVHEMIKSNQKAWLKPYIDMNTELRKNKKWFWKTFSGWWIMHFLEKSGKT